MTTVRAIDTAAAAGSDYDPLGEVAAQVLWLSTAMVHHANRVRPNPTGLKVGGHQASSASDVSIMTSLYFEHLRSGDRVSPCDLPQVSPNLQINNSFRHQTGAATNRGRRRIRFHQMIHGHRRHTPPSASRASMSSGSRRTTTHARPRRQPPPQRPPHTAPPPELLAATAAATAAATTTVILGRNSLTSATNPRSVTSGHF